MFDLPAYLLGVGVGFLLIHWLGGVGFVERTVDLFVHRYVSWKFGRFVQRRRDICKRLGGHDSTLVTTTRDGNTTRFFTCKRCGHAHDFHYVKKEQ